MIFRPRCQEEGVHGIGAAAPRILCILGLDVHAGHDPKNVHHRTNLALRAVDGVAKVIPERQDLHALVRPVQAAHFKWHLAAHLVLVAAVA